MGFIFCVAGLPREPKWGHLRDLHKALYLCKKALLWGTPRVETLGEHLEVSKFWLHFDIVMFYLTSKMKPLQW